MKSITKSAGMLRSGYWLSIALSLPYVVGGNGVIVYASLLLDLQVQCSRNRALAPASRESTNVGSGLRGMSLDHDNCGSV